MVGIHALPLKVVNLCSIVVIKDHSPYSTWQLLREISRCRVRHRFVHLTFVILYRTFQLCATFKHVFRPIRSPCTGAENCLQTRATIEHIAHIYHLRGIEVGNVEFFQTRATLEHPTHICHLRGVEVGEIQRRQTQNALHKPL